MRLVLMAALLVFFSVSDSAAQSQLEIYLPENAEYRYVNATPSTMVTLVPDDWFTVGFDDSTWSMGEGNFGGSFGADLSNNTGPDTPESPGYPNATAWSVHHDPYLRTTFELDSPQDLTLWLAVDNGVYSIFLNGVQATGAVNFEGAAFRWEHVFDIDSSLTVAGTNLVALQLEDHGGATGFAMVITSDNAVVEEPFTFPFLRGDVNNDTLVDISDAVSILTFVFQSSDNVTCVEAADTNDNDELDISDSIYLLNYLFIEGPVLPPPYPTCGFEVGPNDTLECEESPCPSF